jgi:hypothetical protein
MTSSADRLRGKKGVVLCRRGVLWVLGVADRVGCLGGVDALLLVVEVEGKLGVDGSLLLVA